MAPNQIVTLNCGLFEVHVSPKLGGAILAAYYDKNQILQSNVNSTDPRQAGCFVMAPFCGWLPEQGFDWQTKHYSPPSNLVENKPAVHGYAWQNEWQVVAKTSSKLVLNYVSCAEEWPWPFELEQTIILTKQGIEIFLNFTNTANSEAPVSLGLHPYFKIDQTSKIAIHSNQVGTQPKYLNSGNTQDECETFLNWNGSLSITDQHHQMLISAQSSTKLYLGLYRPKQANFVCLEPITQQLNTLVMEDPRLGFDSIGPDESSYLWLKILIVKD